jgi:TPR repeat protein
MLRTILLLLCILSVGCANNTVVLEQGKACFQQQQYDKAFAKLLPLAKQGNADAQYAVGYMYYYGKGVIENPKQAQYWINLAAQQGQPLAIKTLELQASAQIAALSTTTTAIPQIKG